LTNLEKVIAEVLAYQNKERRFEELSETAQEVVLDRRKALIEEWAKKAIERLPVGIIK